MKQKIQEFVIRDYTVERSVWVRALIGAILVALSTLWNGAKKT